MEKRYTGMKKTEEKTWAIQRQTQDMKQMKKRTIIWTTQNQILFIKK